MLGGDGDRHVEDRLEGGHRRVCAGAVAEMTGKHRPRGPNVRAVLPVDEKRERESFSAALRLLKCDSTHHALVLRLGTDRKHVA